MDRFRKPSYLLPIIFLVGFAAWRYGNQVWKGHPGDIYHRWLGSRELLLNGRNPYGKEVTEEIQIGGGIRLSNAFIIPSMWSF